MRAVDYFAGAGGFTLGALAAGCNVVEAINHWSVAVEYHRRNHPATVHRCEDLTRFAPERLSVFELLLASPACQGHSPARGIIRGSDEDARWDASRATAWAVIDCAEVRRPLGIVVENVVAFQKWSLFPMWRGALEALGYHVRVQVLDASRFGVPQERLRTVVTAARKRLPAPIVYPDVPVTPASAVIDLSAGTWTRIDRPGRAAATLARIARGRAAYGERFLMPFYKSGTCRPLTRPLGTLTTRDRWSIVNGDRMRMLSVDEARAAMGFPVGYELPANGKDAMHLLGNAMVPAVAEAGVRSVMEAA